MKFKKRSSTTTEPQVWNVTDPTAGPGEIYKSEHSPFVVKDGVLTEFRPANAIRYLCDRTIHPGARQCLYEGFCAWVICPTKIIKTKHGNDLRLIKSNKFVHNAMMVCLGVKLANAFQIARRLQLKENHGCEANQLLKWGPLSRFPYEILFALGGVEALLHAGSIEQLSKAKANQKRPAENVVEFLRQLRKLQVGPTDSAARRRPRYGKNAPATAAAESMKVSVDTIEGHWEVLEASAPYLYAASLVDNGQLFESLFSQIDGYEDYLDDPIVDQRLSEWFGYALEIAETVLGPKNLLHNWSSIPSPRRSAPHASAGLSRRLLSPHSVDETRSRPRVVGGSDFPGCQRHFPNYMGPRHLVH